MRCFNHPEQDAIGICRNCGRGLCVHCIAIAENAVACRGRCEQRVEMIQRAVENEALTVQTASVQHRRSGVNSVFTGLLFLSMGALIIYFGGNDAAIYFGGAMIAVGFLVAMTGMNGIMASRKYAQLAADSLNQKTESSK